MIKKASRTELPSECLLFFVTIGRGFEKLPLNFRFQNFGYELKRNVKLVLLKHGRGV